MREERIKETSPTTATTTTSIRRLNSNGSGSTSKKKKPWFENRLFMLTFDTIFSTVIVTNLVIFVWRIIWDTQDLYLKSNLYLNSIISIAVSFLLIFYIKYKQFESFKRNDYMGKCEIKLFIILFSFANINHWRGVWNFTLTYTNYSLAGVFLIGAISLLGLLFMNRLCVLVSVPFILNKDCMQAAYQVMPSSNRNDNYLKLADYRLKMTKWLFLLNSMQEYFGDFFTIQSWRSLWFFMDLYVYPHDQTKSALVCVLIGFVSYILIHVFAKFINRFVTSSIHKPCATTTSTRVPSETSSTSTSTSTAGTSNNNKLKKINSFLLQQQHSRSSFVDRYSTSHLITNNGRQKLSSKMPSFAYFNKDLNKRSPIINVDIRENYEKQTETHFGLSNRLFLYTVFTLGFLGTVSVWRGLWMLQMLYAYPKFLCVSNNAVLSQMLLNLVYMILAILILWSLNLTSSLLSRASCQDDYFTASKVYVLRFNNYKAFFHGKFIFSMADLIKLLKLKLFCRQADKDALKIQELVIKSSMNECAILKMPENSV